VDESEPLVAGMPQSGYSWPVYEATANLTSFSILSVFEVGPGAWSVRRTGS